MQYIDFLFDLIKYLAIDAIFGGVIVFLLRNWFLERIKGDIKYVYDAKLEELKNSLGKHRDEDLEQIKSANKYDYDSKLESIKDSLGRQRDEVLELLKSANVQLKGAQDLAADLYKRSHEKGYAKRLEAVQPLWDIVVKIKKDRPSAFMLLDILSPDEMVGSMGKALNKLGPFNADHITSDSLDMLENLRPFIGERLYALIYGYRAIIGRMTFQIIIYKQENKKVEGFDEAVIQQMLSQILLSTEIEHVMSSEYGRLSRFDALVASKALVYLAGIIDAQGVLTDGMEQARRLQEISPDFRVNNNLSS